jgi:DMSO/TMAO reductase YedYZ molybdopterin-dependent catalytic subunit
MKSWLRPGRRGFLLGGMSLALGGCAARVGQSAQAQSVFDFIDGLSYRVQRLLIGADRLAPEYTEREITKVFKPNGSIDPKDPAYKRLVKEKFASWKLEIGGLVENPMSFSLTDLRALPSRTQITRHDCVEGWSCIAKWKGTPLSVLLDAVKPKPQARFVVFRCIDTLGPDEVEDLGGDDDDEDDDRRNAAIAAARPHYYESIDFNDARHPQTILAYDMNDAPLSVQHGAPIRLRLERQLGYKMAKYVMRMELVESFANLGRGKGGYWEDLGYDWYAGV